MEVLDLSKKMISGLLGMVLIGSLVAGQAGAAGTRNTAPPSHDPLGSHGDYKELPKFVQKWQNQKAAAADAVVRGAARVRANGTVKLPNGAFVDYVQEDEDHIVTLLAQFSDPAAGLIAEPDREVDNATYWETAFDKAHYEEMLFSEGGNVTGLPSMRDFYLQLSDGRYTVDGQVSDWVTINAPESDFGANSVDGGDGSDNLNGPVYRVVEAALNATSAVDEGINWDPAVVDVWDRYDCDLDGNFDEADGYVDHFQLVHAGQGEEEGGGAQAGDAIWSHRWYAGQEGIGTEGPAGAPAGCLQGGYQVPGTGLWVGDYTVEPENGAVGVFSHEFGHDLGLPDLYDTTYVGESAVEFWSLMSGGSWASADPDAIGTQPTHMDAWSKAALGWVRDLDLGLYDYKPNGKNDKTFKLGPAEGATEGRKQIVRVNLPDYEYTETLPAAPEPGDPYYYYSGQGDNVENVMEHQLGAPLAADTALTFRTWYDIEEDWDYAYVEASSDAGVTYVPLDGNLSTETNPNGQNQGHGITGASGDWVGGAYTVPAGTDAIRFRYWTDGAFSLPGFIVDSIALGDFSDDGSNVDAWELGGFTPVTDGVMAGTAFHYYLVESREYLRNDVSLKGAYNFIEGNWLEKNSYADGVLIWYRDSRWGDNNVGLHPGHGLILPVDSHPKPAMMPDGENYWRTRWQTWDATFGNDFNKVHLTQVLDSGWKTKTYKSGPVDMFFDSSKKAYWNAKIPDASTKTAGSGLKIKVIGRGKGGKYRIVIK